MNSILTFWGKVRKGKGRGRLLGFPTANIALHKHIPEGIYASNVYLNKKKYLAVTFIGSSKTFGEKDVKAESYMFDFKESLYGKWISIKLIKKTRNNQKFISEEALVEQMKKDITMIKLFFKI
jgi:riboflavin kinase/FMN adenylyltransferase